MAQGSTEGDGAPVSNAKKQDEKKGANIENLSSEDLEVREELDSLVEALHSDDETKHAHALESFKKHCQIGSDSMASLPRYLRLLNEKVSILKAVYHKWSDKYVLKKDLANIISAVSITDTEEHDCLTFRLNGRADNLADWGIEYVRHLAEELRLDFEGRVSKHEGSNSVIVADILDLAISICKFYMKNNCEIDAADLCGDLDYNEKLELLIDEVSVHKVCRYMLQCVNFVLREDVTDVVHYIYSFYKKFNLLPECLIAASKLLEVDTIHDVVVSAVENTPPGYTEAQGKILQRQLALMVAHFGIYYNITFDRQRGEQENYVNLKKYINNNFLIRAHEELAAELDILKPHSPDDIYRISGNKLTAYYTAGYVSDPPRMNLGSAFVSGLVNAAFKTDLLLVSDPTSRWLLTQKEYALMNSVACTGLLYLWNIEEGLLHADKFINSQNRFVKAGGLMALGICSSNCRDPCESPFAILSEYLLHTDPLLKKAACLSMGLAFAGTDDWEVLTALHATLTSPNTDSQAKGIAALSMGLIACGTSLAEEVSPLVLDALYSMQDHLDIMDPYHRLIPLGLGLIYIGRNERIPSLTKEIKNIPGGFGRWCGVILKICGNAGTGNVLAIQRLLAIINEIPQPESKDRDPPPPSKGSSVDSSTGDGSKPAAAATHGSNSGSGGGTTSSSSTSRREKRTKDTQTELELLQGLATVGLALISLNEDISQKMGFRLLNLFLQFGSIGVRRAVPIALGVLSASNPQVSVIELLSKLSHDVDSIVSSNAIIALGLVSAGSNNSRVANMLRNLGIFFYRDPVHLFAIRLAQGLVHLSKGLVSLSPFRAHNMLIAPITLAVLIIHATVSVDVKNAYLTMDPHLLFYLVPAMKLKALITYDENFKMVPVPVRIGQAVDVTGQAGKPKKITGFQTQRTPVLINSGEEAELATDQYIPYTNILENIVIVRKNFNENQESI